MATFPTGMMSTTTTELGDFDQCLSIDGSFSGDSFVGKYCLATVNLPRPALFKTPAGLNTSALEPTWIGKYIDQWYIIDSKNPIASGICFPSLCNQAEIKDILQSCKSQFSQLA